MIQILINFFAFIAAIGILVTFHEFGHFWTARRLGVKVLRFSVGFGKALWIWRDKKETEYVIAAIPLGGYVKMLDEREGAVPDSIRHQAFNCQPLWKRFAIVLAGPLFNFIFAIIAYWFVLIIGIEGIAPIVGTVQPSSIAAQAGIQENDEIQSIDGVKTNSWQQVVKELMKHIGRKDTLVIQTKHQDEEINHELNLQEWALQEDKPELLASLGLEPYLGPIKPQVHKVMNDEPAEKAGLKENDQILSVNDEPIQEWRDFTKIVARNANNHLNLNVQRGDETIRLVLTPRAKTGYNGTVSGFVGIIVKSEKVPDVLIRKEHHGPWDAFLGAFRKTKEYTLLTFTMLGKLLTGTVGLKTLSGPITIAQGAGASVTVGFQYFLSYLALISISLGVLNLLPIPILDGGHLMYYVIEGLTGRPVSEKIQLLGYKIGLFFLLFIMSVAFFNDIIRLF